VVRRPFLLSLLIAFPFLAVAVTSAVTPDLRLLPLIPPGAQFVAGTSVSSTSGQPASYLVATRNNTVDFRDFISLAGVDDSRIIRQLVLVAAADDKGLLTDHSLLAVGHFDQARIFKSVVENGAGITEFKGIPVLVLQPLERDRSTFNDVRWLAVLESDIAIFGTVTMVRQELERHLANSVADPVLMRKLARLRRDDVSWCILAAFFQNYETRRVLGSLDPVLADPAHDGDAFQFGIHFGRQVEFEYEITPASTACTRIISDSLPQSLAGLKKDSTLLPLADAMSGCNPIQGVIKVSIARYNAWLAEVAARDMGSLHQTSKIVR
jgi:hypothetical protein